MSCRLILALMLLLTAKVAVAGDASLGDLKVSDAWARASIGPGLVGVAYFTVTNEGEQSVDIQALSTPVAGEAMLHATVMEDGVMKMRALEDTAIEPGEQLQLSPGGNHIMLMSLTAPLKEGEQFRMTIDFGEAGQLEVSVDILSATSDGASHGDHSSHGHSSD